MNTASWAGSAKANRKGPEPTLEWSTWKWFAREDYKQPPRTIYFRSATCDNLNMVYLKATLLRRSTVLNLLYELVFPDQAWSKIVFLPISLDGWIQTKIVSCLLHQMFRISVTFEMRTTKCGEIYISIAADTTAEWVYKG